MAVPVTLTSPLAEQLSSVIQPKLEEVGWISGGSDDSTLTEYIILMLVNGKTQDQIAAELSNDLLNLGPEDSGASDFSRWLFEQVDVLSGRSGDHSSSQAPSIQQSQAQPIPSYTGQQDMEQSRRGSKKSGSPESPDTEMGETMDSTQDGHIPTGPKFMRSGGRQNNRRLMGQISKAMDRSTENVLHRVRPQQGTERINMHARQPPKGPRSDQFRNQRVPQNGRPMAPMNGSISNGGLGAVPMQMTPQQQMQLFAMYEQQARVMSEIFSPQQQQVFMPGTTPLINPAFRNGASLQPQQPTRSLFERVEGKPQRPNGCHNKRAQPNDTIPNSQPPQDTEMIKEEPSSMEIDSLQTVHKELSADTVCKFNLKCTKADCPYAHQSPTAPAGTTIDVTDHCPFGVACKNVKCAARHPSPAQKLSHHLEQDCRYFPNCTNAKCPFRHPTTPVCRFGANCTRSGCPFTHIKTMCKFNPCLNSACLFKHEDGQKRGAFHDKVWKAEGTPEGHVSERKFVVGDVSGEEELIIPGGSAMGENQPLSEETEVL